MSFIETIDRLAGHYENSDTQCAGAALLNLQTGAPAYWSRSTHANVLACRIHLDANRFGALIALERHAIEGDVFAASREYLITTLIPLNEPACDELCRVCKLLLRHPHAA